MDRAHLYGPMVQLTEENFKIITSMEEELINGLTAENIVVNGEIIKCMEKVYSLGRMEEDTKENILMIKNMDMVSSFGQMDVFIRDIGKMENNTEEDYIREVMALKEKVNGETERKLDGFRSDQINYCKHYIINVK